MLIFILIGCDEVVDELDIDDEPPLADDIVSEVIITVDDNTLSPSRIFSDSFSISAPENFIDISGNIVSLPFDTSYDNIAFHTISIEPPVDYPRALVYTRLPHHSFWDFQLLRHSWSISHSPPAPEWSEIALFGYTTDSSSSTDTLTLNLSINGSDVFVDSTIVLTFLPLNNAVYRSIPGTDNGSQSSQRVRFLSREFSANVSPDYRDPRNIHNFVFYQKPEAGGWAAWTRLSSAGYWYDSAWPTEAYIFFSNLPE